MTRRSLYSTLVALVTAPFAKFAKPKPATIQNPTTYEKMAEDVLFQGTPFSKYLRDHGVDNLPEQPWHS
jgi:hypothetical protein